MASALAQQLAQLASVKNPQERYVRGKPSLLFDYQKAADVSAETLLGIAQQGVETLWKADKRFAPFPESLFSRASLSISRDQLTKDESNELNTKLRAFLHVLTNHFLAPAAFQALEYCIRRYQVHVYNVDDLLVCALPYHATPEFARLVALLQLKGTAWEWLSPCQQSGAPPPRELIVRRCVNDQAVLREICKGAQALGVAGFVSKTFLSFYAVLLCEVLTASPQVTEQLLNGLLPYLVSGLKDSAARDYRAATLMVLTQLLSQAQLQKDFLAVIVAEVIRSAADLGGSTALMLLAHMAASQPQLHVLAPRTLQMMVEHCEEVGQQFADLQVRGANLQPLLKLLLPSLARALPHHPQLQPLLEDLLNSVHLDAAQVESATLQLLQAGALLLQQGGEAAGQHLQQALHVFDLRFPNQLDAAINKALQQSAASGAAVEDAAVAGSKTAKPKKAKQQAVTDANTMFEFVQQCFSGSRHEVVPVWQQDSGAAAAGAQQQQQALTLSLAVSAPASQMRIMALQKLDAICAAGDAPESTQHLLQSSLVTCLRDDVFAVAGAAAAAAGLAAVPADQQLPALQYLLARAAEKLATGSAKAGNTADGSITSSGGKETLKAAKAALAAVAAVGERAAADTDAADRECVAAVQQQAATILLEYMLADKRLKKLSKAAVSVHGTWHPLLQAISAAPAVAAALQHAHADADTAAPTTSDSKRRKKSSKTADSAASTPASEGKHAAALALNRAVVQALADALCCSHGGAPLLTALSDVAASCGPRCQHLLLLALLKAVASAPSEVAAADVQPTPARGKGKGRQPLRTSQTVGDDQQQASTATSARIALVMLQMLEQSLGSPAHLGGSSSNFVLPKDWQAMADDVFDGLFLPSEQHLQQLHSELPQLQAALLLSGLKNALEAAAPDSLTGLLGQPVQLFARIAAAAAAATAGSSLLDHLHLLVQKSCQQPQQQLSFVAGIYGLPSSSCAEAAQTAALQVLQRQYSSSTVGDGSTGSSWFVALLAAAESSNRAVRNAAVDALLALSEHVNSSSESWGLQGGFTAAHLSQLVAALQQHKALLRGSSGSMTPLLCGALAAAASGMDVDSGVGSGKGRATRRGSKASSNAEGDATDVAAAVAHAELHLPASCAAALQQLMIAVLPDLHVESSLAAAELVVAALAAGAAAAADVATAAQQLLQALLQGLCANATKAAAAAVENNACTAIQLPAWRQLSFWKGGSAAVSGTAAQLQHLRASVAVTLLQFYTSESMQAVAGLADSYVDLLQLPYMDAAAVDVQPGSSSGKLSDAQLAVVAAVRTAALQRLDDATFAVLSPEQQQVVFAAVLQTHATDGDASCRAAARSALQRIPVTAGMLLQLLQRVGNSPASTVTQQQQQTRAKRSKRASTAASSQQELMDIDAAAAGPVLAADLDAAIAALELLQWKEDVQGKQQLLQPLQQLLQLLTPLMGSIAESHKEYDTAAGDAITPLDDQQAAAASAAATGIASPSAAGYAAQLALTALELLVKEQKGSGTGGRVDPSLVLSCASAAPDGAVRNAALLLLAVLSQQSPEDVLGHVLQALAVIQHSAAFQADSHSQAVASAALAALVPAWLAAGRGSEELWSSLIAALPGLPASRRLKLLEALRKALPEDAGLRVGLLLLMQRVVAATSLVAAAAATPATLPSPPGKTPGKKGKEPAAAAAEPAEGTAATAADEAEWLPDLMAALCEQVPVPSRLQAFASVLSASLTDSATGGTLPAHSPLPRLAVAFVTANLKAKSVLSAAHAAAPVDGSNSEAALSISEACHSIMTQALMHLQQLNPAAAAAASSSKSVRKVQKAIRAAATGVYDLLAGLEAVQDCPSYLLALVQMSRHAADSVQRRALKLLAQRLLKVQIDLADLETATAALSAAEKQVKQRELAQAGLAVCQELPRLLKAETPLTRQLALIAADAGMRQFGGLLPSAVLSALGVVVSAVSDAAAPVRVSALACIAAAIGAVGPKVVPFLPETAAAVLTAAQAACKDLEGFDHQQPQDNISGNPQHQQQAAAESDDDEAAAAAELSRGEAAALQLAGALAALLALVSGLHAFMSPYLKQILQLLLHRQVLACSTAGAADAAAKLRAMLPAKVPPRLLLDPLVSQWDYAVAASSGHGSAAHSAVAMLELVTVLCSSMEPAVAMKHHEQLLGLLLRALDTRHRYLAAAAGQQRAAGPTDGPDAAAAAAAVASFGHTEVHAIETAAVEALSSLVIKLSESKFKPMFLRMVEWATAGSGSAAAAAADDTSGNAAQVQGRAAAFFAAVCALGHRLRSIFAPYYRYFNVYLMKHLAGEAFFSSSSDKRPKKKHRKSAAAATDQPGGEELLLSGWLARLRAVRSVHLLALIEPAAAAPAAVQEQQERFDRLLPLVVDALAEGPPTAVAAILAVEGADSVLDLPGGTVAALGAAGKAAVDAGGAAAIAEQCDIVGTAAVGALMQMAEAGGSDVMWKPLHHALLMATRGGGVRAKLLGIGGVSRLAEMLREEYLMLLPEALPFISELIEDGELAVEGAAQGLVAQLEALSGERLEQYLKA